MERKFAEGLALVFKEHGIEISVEEVMKMKPIPSDLYQIYAIHIGDSTYLSWICPEDPKRSFVKKVHWP